MLRKKKKKDSTSIFTHCPSFYFLNDSKHVFLHEILYQISSYVLHDFTQNIGEKIKPWYNLTVRVQLTNLMPIPWGSHFAVKFYAEYWSEDKNMVQFDC